MKPKKCILYDNIIDLSHFLSPFLLCGKEIEGKTKTLSYKKWHIWFKVCFYFELEVLSMFVFNL